jgi:hypothetical protein
MSNTYFLEKYAEMRQKEFEEAARLARLIQGIEAEKPRFWHKLTWQLGDWMIVLGHRLMGDNFKLMDSKETAHN